ncbi:MAG: PrsW family glutamic-type intramembrane protease [Chloroflexi bacterium]|nr:PrsW family glutamic-type intramembrane protease [Chloroflexota bacterium]
MTAALRWTGRAARVAILVVFVALTGYGTLISGRHITDYRLLAVAIAVLVTAPGWLLLAFAARARGAPWAWLAFTAGWGATAAIWLSLLAGIVLEPVTVAIGRAAESLGTPLAEAVARVGLAPLVEEPAKLLGAWIAFAAARRSGTAVTVGLGAAIGAVVGLAFGIGEAAHRIALVIGDIGFVDLGGIFVIDRALVQAIFEQEMVHRFFAFGLANHALFSGLAGAGLALLFLRRRRLAAACFVAALVAHAAANAVGGPISASIFEALVLGVGPIARGAVPALLAGWLAAAGAFIVSEGWAAVLLIRILRGRGSRAEPVVRTA